MRIEIDGILPAVGSMPITEWEIYVDGEKQIIRSFESRGFREFAIEVEPLVVIKKSLEEEKKMLNFDKYREELLEQIEGGKNGKFGKGAKYLDYFANAIRAARNIHGDKFPTSLNDDIEWLFSEYEPPMLDNGDGLKPGDWIMVRQYPGEEWLRVKFAFFNNEFFYAISENASFDRDTMSLYRWQQARLPEEGE